MAREKIRATVPMRNADGEMVNHVVGDVVDHKEPWIDEDLQLIPEFVNVSGKVQYVTVPFNPDGTIEVYHFQVLRGAQWRYLSRPNKAWGEHPFFMERTSKNGKYDDKYLLTQDQAIKEIHELFRKKRVDRLLNNMIISGPDEQMTPDGKPDNRSRDDRAKVIAVWMEKNLELEEIERKKREEQGYFEEA